MAQSSRVVIHRAGISGYHVSMDRFDTPTTPYYQEMELTKFIKIVLFFELDFFRLWDNANFFYFFNKDVSSGIYELYKTSLYKSFQKLYIIEPSEVEELLDTTTVTTLNANIHCLTIRYFRISNHVIILVPLYKVYGGNFTINTRLIKIVQKILNFWITSSCDFVVASDAASSSLI